MSVTVGGIAVCVVVLARVGGNRVGGMSVTVGGITGCVVVLARVGGGREG